jgi:Na+-transporting NADH:ubiquinone oxidoreductase subunit NqrC
MRDVKLDRKQHWGIILVSLYIIFPYSLECVQFILSIYVYMQQKQQKKATIDYGEKKCNQVKCNLMI